MKKPSLTTRIKESYRESHSEAVVQNILHQIRSNQRRIEHKEADIQQLRAENQQLSRELTDYRNSYQQPNQL